MKQSKTTDYSDYFLSFMQSFLAHTLIIAFLFLTADIFSGSAQTQVGKLTPEVDLVQAVSINETAVLAEIARQKAEENTHQETVHMAQAAKKAAEEANKALQLLKQRQAALNLQAEKERDALKALQEKKSQQEKELKVLNEQKLQEQEKLKKVKEAQLVAEKKHKEQEKLAKEKAEQQRLAQEAQAAKVASAKQATLAARKKFLDSERLRYMALIKQKVDQSWILPGEETIGLVCDVDIQLLPDGSVMASRVVKSSGNFAFDRATEVAISRASPLPMPEDKTLIEEFRHFILSFRKTLNG